MNIGFMACIVLGVLFLIVGILFFKSVHLDAEKAFEKYLIK